MNQRRGNDVTSVKALHLKANDLTRFNDSYLNLALTVTYMAYSLDARSPQKALRGGIWLSFLEPFHRF